MPKCSFPEVYVAWRPFDALAITYGLQNFQWGPAELVSPSNRVFHETGVFRDPLYSVRGKHLLRANVSVGRQWSLVALAELSHNGAGADEAFQAGVPFQATGPREVRVHERRRRHLRGRDPRCRGRGAPRVRRRDGTWMLSDALALYIDASHGRGSAAYVSGAAAWTARRSSTARVATATTGRRWRWWWRLTCSRGATRCASKTSTRMRATATSNCAMRSPPCCWHRIASSTQRFLAPGLEFVGRDLALVSLRLPDLPPARRINGQARYLGSITDGSGVVFTTLSLNATDAMVAFATAAVTHGASHAEFSRLVGGFVTVGVVYAF